MLNEISTPIHIGEQTNTGDMLAELRKRLDWRYREIVEESSIDPAVAYERGYYLEKSKSKLARLGFGSKQARAGIVIPRLAPDGEELPPQLKPNAPIEETKNGKTRMRKYETPTGSRIRLSVHPRTVKILRDAGCPLWITEGEKKGDCLVSHRFPAIVLQGTGCWDIPEDWEEIKIYGRKFIIAFDADILTNKDVARQAEKLAAFLKNRGGRVKLLKWPEEYRGTKTGVDDYLASGDGTIKDLARMCVGVDEPEVDGVDGVDGLSVTLPNAQAFPVGAMPAECQALVNEAAASIGCPVEFVALPMLVTLGAAIGNARRIAMKGGWEESASLYGAIIAPPGGKKTPASKVAMRPAQKTQAGYRRAYQKELEEYKRELREYEVEKRDARADGRAASPPPEPPIQERTLVEDTTIEALASILSDNSRGVVVAKDELAGWVRAMDQYKAGGKGADRQFWLSSWSSAPVTIDRKGRDESLMLEAPLVGVIGGIQPTVLGDMASTRDDGLADRFLFAYPEPRLMQWTDEEITKEAEAEYRGLYDRLRELHMPTDDYGDPDPQRVILAPDAKQLLREAVNEHNREVMSPGFPQYLAGPWAKLEAYIGRIALILAVCRSTDAREPERVEKIDLLGALALVDYFKAHAWRVYAAIYGQNPEDILVTDLVAFLENQGGHFKDEPAVLHAALESRAKPRQPAELTKGLKAIAKRHSNHVGFDDGSFKKNGQGRRFVELTLRKPVDPVDLGEV